MNYGLCLGIPPCGTVQYRIVPYRTLEYNRGQFQHDPHARNVLLMISVRYGTICVHHVHYPYLPRYDRIEIWE